MSRHDSLHRGKTHIAVRIDVAFDRNLVAVDEDAEEALADRVLIRFALEVTPVNAVLARVGKLDDRHGLHTALRRARKVSG